MSEKPYPEFPLTKHRNGQWCKKIRGKLHYFGILSDWETALKTYLASVDYLKAGLTPPSKVETIAEVLAMVLQDKEGESDSELFSRGHFVNQRACVKRLLKCLARGAQPTMPPTEWAAARARLAKLVAPTTLNTTISILNSLFGYAVQMGYLDSLPKFGPGWTKATHRQVREHLAKRDRIVTPARFKDLLSIATLEQRGWLYLGLNCGFGPVDVSTLNLTHVTGNVIQLPRPKTGTHREAWLWPETREAIEDMIPYGVTAKRISQVMADLMKPNTMYDLRHTFATTADQFADSRAVDVVMGHSDGSVKATYRHGVDADRIKKACEFVRKRFLGR